MLKRAVEQLTQQNDGLASALATKTKLVEAAAVLQCFAVCCMYANVLVCQTLRSEGAKILADNGSRNA